MWYNIFVSFFQFLDFEIIEIDYNVFINYEIKMIIEIYVNDLFIVEQFKEKIVKLKTTFKKRFYMKNMNFCNFWLKFKIIRNRARKILQLNQTNYLQQILKKFDMWKSKQQIIFMNIFIKLKKIFDNYQIFKEFKHRYQFVVDFFIYIMLNTRSDIVFAIFVIFRFNFNFINAHWIVVKQIFQYFRNFINLCLIYKENLQSFFKYKNVNWTENVKTRRFISKYIFNLNNDVINWFFKRQKIVILSICEIEYRVQTEIKKKIL